MRGCWIGLSFWPHFAPPSRTEITVVRSHELEVTGISRRDCRLPQCHCFRNRQTKAFRPMKGDVAVCERRQSAVLCLRQITIHPDDIGSAADGIPHLLHFEAALVAIDRLNHERWARAVRKGSRECFY